MFLRFFAHPHARVVVAGDGQPAMIGFHMMILDDCSMRKLVGDRDIAMSRATPCGPIFEVEVIDVRGHARLFAGLHLHEAIKISADFEGEPQPGREPRVYIRPAHLSVGLTDN